MSENMKAIAYAGLVGKYIHMSRPATSEEREHYKTDTIFMGCYVISVADRFNGVEIRSDYGFAFVVEDDEDWKFEIYQNQEQAERANK